MGGLTQVTYAVGKPEQASVSYTYTLDGQKATSTDENGNASSFYYDGVGDLNLTYDGAVNRMDYNYDGDHRLTSVPELSISYAYDARSRLSTTTYAAISPNPATTKLYTYDGMGRVLTTTDQAGKVTTDAYDATGQLTSVTDALTHVTNYSYDLDGNLATVTDAGGRLTAYQYDNLNRRTGRTLPLGMSETYGYDLIGNRTRACSHYRSASMMKAK